MIEDTAPNEPNEPDDDQDKSSENITRFLKIPKLFYSVEKDAPFIECILCGANLFSTNRHYVIEKIYRGSEVIIELAMCLDCRGNQSEEGMSEKSAKMIQQFLSERIDFQRRMELMSQVNDQDSIDPWLERCLLSDQPGQMFREYQIVALCRGPWIQRDFYPALISGKSLETLTDVLSDETRDWMDDFIGSNFGMPSEFCQPPSFTPIIV